MLVLIATFLAAYCSMTYQLLLAQLLSAVLGATALQYSITIGLYVFSLGLGAIRTPVEQKAEAARKLLRVEIALSFLGILSPAILIAVDFGGSWLTALTGYYLVVTIGYLSGKELPLLFSFEPRHRVVLSWDYFAGFFATIAFAFALYPIAGTIFTAISTSMLNVLCGFFVYLIADEKSRTLALVLFSLFCLLTAALAFEAELLNLASLQFGR